MIVGLIINWGLALVALLGSEDEFMEVNMSHLLLTIPVWPLTLWQLVSSFTGKDDPNGN